MIVITLETSVLNCKSLERLHYENSDWNNKIATANGRLYVFTRTQIGLDSCFRSCSKICSKSSTLI